jgi:DNA adenine methylase
MKPTLKAPFPWFGGKSRAASLIWSRFGDVPNYVEPFAGSLAVLLARPTPPGNEIVNDLDCYVANAWRAVQADPDAVAEVCDWPVNEADLHARHRWLHGRVEFRERMKNDPDYFDARIAGYWIWGLSCWIGDNFCRPKDQESLPHLTGGTGVARKVPHLTGGKGVARKVPHLTGGTGDRGVNARALRTEEFPHVENCSPKIPYLDTRRKFNTTQGANLVAWFAALSARLRFTKICCGDWTRILSKAATYGQGITGALLDPPYDTDGHDDVYGDMSRGVSGAVKEWAITNGGNPLLRIALCGYAGEHAMPPEWDCVAWKACGGYGGQRADKSNDNAARERIWFSPACQRAEQGVLL